MQNIKQYAKKYKILAFKEGIHRVVHLSQYILEHFHYPKKKPHTY